MYAKNTKTKIITQCQRYIKIQESRNLIQSTLGHIIIFAADWRPLLSLFAALWIKQTHLLGWHEDPLTDVKEGIERHLYHQSPPAITPILVSTQPIPEGSKDADLMPSRHQLWHTCQIIHATNSQDDFWKRTFLCLCGYENCMTMPHVNMLTHENESYIRSNKTY